MFVSFVQLCTDAQRVASRERCALLEARARGAALVWVLSPPATFHQKLTFASLARLHLGRCSVACERLLCEASHSKRGLVLHGLACGWPRSSRLCGRRTPTRSPLNGPRPRARSPYEQRRTLRPTQHTRAAARDLPPPAVLGELDAQQVPRDRLPHAARRASQNISRTIGAPRAAGRGPAGLVGHLPARCCR